MTDTATIESLCQRVDALERAARFGFKKVLTVKEVASFLNKSERTIRQMMADNVIPFYKNKKGTRNYFSRTEIEEYLLSRKVPTQQETEQAAATYNVLRKMTRQRRLHA